MFGKRKFDNTTLFGNSTNKKNKNTSDVESNDKINALDLDMLKSLSPKNSDRKIERENNHIYFHSEIDRDSIFELTSLLREAEEENYFTSFKLNIPEIPIYLHINSFGGSIFAAFNAIDTIKACKVPVYSIIESCAASAATLISIVCTKRYIKPSSYMLIHQLSSGIYGKMCEIEDEIQNLTALMENIKDIYKEYTDIPKKELTHLLNHDLWLNKDKCLKYKLVDEEWI